MSKPLKLDGQKFGKLTVIRRVGSDSHGQSLWECKCECGNIIITRGNSLRQNMSKSCGCTRKKSLREAKSKHGMYNTRLFSIWNGMKFRCHNPNHKDYKDYMGKGVTICEEWDNDFLSFYNWAMANGYKDNLSIDRIDVNGNYEPSNCRWADDYIQANNRTNNRFVTYHGETDTITNMCKKLNVNLKTIYGRVQKCHYSFEDAIDKFDNTPPYREYKYKKKKAI